MPALMNKKNLFLIGGRALQAALNLVTLRVMTTLLAPSEAGKVFLVVAYAAGFAVFLITPAGTYMARRIHSWELGKNVLSRLSCFALYIFLVSVLAFLSLFLLKPAFPGAGGSPFAFAALTAVYICASCYSMTFIPALNLLGYQKEFSAYTVALAAAALVFSSLAVFRSHAGYTPWLCGQILAMLGISGLAYLKLKAALGENIPGPFQLARVLMAADLRAVASFSIPLGFATLFLWFQNQGYRLVVELRAGTEFLGYLAIGLGIAASLGAVVETLIQQIYYPDFYKKITGASPGVRREAFRELVEKAVPAYAVLVIFTVSLAPHLTRLLVAPRYFEVAKFVALGAFVEFFRMASGVVSAAAHSEMRTRTLIVPYAAGGLAVLAGVYLSGPSASRDSLIPAALIAGAGMTFFILRAEIARAMSFDLKLSVLARPLLFAAPLTGFLAVHAGASTALSALLVFLAGLYFIFLQYLLACKTGGTRAGCPVPEEGVK